MGMFKRSGYWQHVSPTGALSDLVGVWHQAGKNRWRIALLSACCTFGIFWMMWLEEGKGPHPPPKVTYITSWRADRTDEEIIASNIENQKFKDEFEAEQAVREKRVREIYKSLGRYTGVDVDRIEQEALAEKEAAESARKQRAAELKAQFEGE